MSRNPYLGNKMDLVLCTLNTKIILITVGAAVKTNKVANDRLVYIGLTGEFPAKPDTVRSHHLDGTATALLNSGLTSLNTSSESQHFRS